MVSLQKVQMGVSRFIETEITAQFTGWKKLLAETAIGLYMAQLPAQVEALAKNPMFAGMGLVKGDQVDLDRLYNELDRHFQQPVAVDIPMLGTAQFTRENLATLYQMIQNA